MVGIVVIGLSILVSLITGLVKLVQSTSKPTDELIKTSAGLKESMIELNATLKSMRDEQREHRRINEKEHDELFDQVTIHDQRLIKLETEHSHNYGSVKQ